MGVEVDVVTKPEFDGEIKIIDERFVRGKERIDKIEDIQADLVKLNAQFAEIIKTEREQSKKTEDDVSDMKGIITRLDEVLKQLNENDKDKSERIAKLESEPKNKLDKISGWFFGSATGCIVGYVMNAILH